MKKIRVHIADDHQVLVDGIRTVLGFEDHIEIVGTSSDGEAVIKWFEHNQADVLLLDINMPKLDGIAVMRWFEEQDRNQRIVVLSSYDDPKLIKEVLKIGVSGFISKTCAADSMVEAVNEVFKGQQYFSKNVQEKLMRTFSKKESDRATSVKERYFFSSLTQRELQVLRLIARQYNSREISQQLQITQNTVETHRKRLISKLGVKNVVGLAIYAYKNDLV